MSWNSSQISRGFVLFAMLGLLVLINPSFAQEATKETDQKATKSTKSEVAQNAESNQSSSKSGEKQGDEKDVTGKKVTEKNASGKREVRGRLPRHFTKFVDGIQREKIYVIQQKYEKQLEELEKQIEALENQQEKEIEALLRPDQITKLKQLREAARSK